jgi:hypothetical protein
MRNLTDVLLCTNADEQLITTDSPACMLTALTDDAMQAVNQMVWLCADDQAVHSPCCGYIACCPICLIGVVRVASYALKLQLHIVRSWHCRDGS